MESGASATPTNPGFRYAPSWLRHYLLQLLINSSLAAIPQKQRHLQAGTELRELADEHAKGDLLLMDNIELLFDTSLQLNPLDLLKRHAHSMRVVAVWPGELRNGRLTYADMGHSEYRDYATEGFVALEMQ